MSRKVGTEVEVTRNTSEKWGLVWVSDGVTVLEYVRCSTALRALVIFAGEWPPDIQNDPALAPMRAAAERIWWENKTPGEDEWRHPYGPLCRFTSPVFDGFNVEWLGRVMWTSGKVEFSSYANQPLEPFLAAAVKWHRANYVLADDEWYSPDGPAKMRDDQVRDGAGNAQTMVFLQQFNDVAFHGYCSILTLKDVPAEAAAGHPARVTGQRARIEAFLARNTKTDKLKCRIADSDNDSIELELSGPLQRGQLTAASQDEGHAVSVLLTSSNLRKLAETATKIADRIEGKSPTESLATWSAVEWLDGGRQRLSYVLGQRVRIVPLERSSATNIGRPVPIE